MNVDDLIVCTSLHCRLRAAICVARQLEAERAVVGAATTRACERRADPNRAQDLARHDGKRGRGHELISCWRCPQGRELRAAIGDSCAREVRTGVRRPAAAAFAR